MADIHCTSSMQPVLFYVYVLDQMIRNGDVELQGREEEIRFLEMQKAEDQRSIALLRKTLPSKQAQEQELVTLQIQVQHSTYQKLKLILYCLTSIILRVSFILFLFNNSTILSKKKTVMTWSSHPNLNILHLPDYPLLSEKCTCF